MPRPPNEVMLLPPTEKITYLKDILPRIPKNKDGSLTFDIMAMSEREQNHFISIYYRFSLAIARRLLRQWNANIDTTSDDTAQRAMDLTQWNMLYLLKRPITLNTDIAGNLSHSMSALGKATRQRMQSYLRRGPNEYLFNKQKRSRSIEADSEQINVGAAYIEEENAVFDYRANDTPNPETQMLERERQHVLPEIFRRALPKLRANQRVVLCLRYQYFPEQFMNWFTEFANMNEASGHSSAPHNLPKKRECVSAEAAQQRLNESSYTEDSLTLQQIGDIFGLSRERIRQIEYSGQKNLHKVLVGTEEYFAA